MDTRPGLYTFVSFAVSYDMPRELAFALYGSGTGVPRA